MQEATLVAQLQINAERMKVIATMIRTVKKVSNVELITVSRRMGLYGIQPMTVAFDLVILLSFLMSRDILSLS